MLLRSTLALAALGLAGCNSFDPSYGDEPFRCGDSAPRCPDGYTCTAPGDDGVCVRDDEEPPPDAAPPDSPPPPCRLDIGEPNDVRNKATPTPVPTEPTYVVDDLTMCVATDHDFFQFGLPTNSRLRITADGDSEPLTVKVLLVNGTEVGTGTAVNGNVTVFQAPGANTPATLSAGVYYVDVSSPTASFSAYRLEIKTCPAAQATCLDQ